MQLSWAVYPASCVRMRCLQAVAAWPTTSQQPRLYHHMTLTQFHNRGCCRCSSQDHPWHPSSAGAAAGQAGAAACSAAAAGRSDSGAGPYAGQQRGAASLPSPGHVGQLGQAGRAAPRQLGNALFPPVRHPSHAHVSSRIKQLRPDLSAHLHTGAVTSGAGGERHCDYGAP